MKSNFATALRWVIVAQLAASLLGADAKPPAPSHPLAWDAMEKTVDSTVEAHEVKFVFHVTNTSKEAVEVVQIEPSCGCTVAEMPSTPWVLAPGAQGSFTAVVDHRGKFGKLFKTLHVHSSGGSQTLSMIINLPDTEESRRSRNQQFAFADRQAVFRGDCAACHVLPTLGKSGEALFKVACGICHEAASRAPMVPDLMVVREKRDAAFWARWISEGKEQTLMPAFAAKRGGPLNDEQISSLVEFALRHFPTEPKKE